MDDILRGALPYLERGESLALVTIVSQTGSTPRTAGARMCVAAPATGGTEPLLVAGTVGGGLVEAKAMQAALQVLGGAAPQLLNFDLSGELAAGADMICGGRLELFVECLGQGDLPLLRALAQSAEQGRSAYSLTAFDGRGRWLAGEAAPDTLPKPEFLPTAEELARSLPPNAQAAILDLPEGRFLIQAWRSAPRIILAGGGHVALSVSQVAVPAGFSCIVLDDREEFANHTRFPLADQVKVVPEFTDCFAGLETGPDTSIVILSRGHLHDAAILEQALRCGAGYIGMIGSRRKRESVYESLMSKGFSRAELDKVHCPIGLPLGGQTPGEIAVSIVAEIIGFRNGGKK